MVLTAKKLTFPRKVEQAILRITEEKGQTPEEVIVELIGERLTEKERAWKNYQAIINELAPKIKASGPTEEWALENIS